MTTILLTGGAGYIGSHTVLEFLNAGVDVVVADNFSNSSPVSMRRVEKLTGKKVVLYEADVCDRVAMRRIFAENDIDAIVHFAGFKAVGESVADPLKYYNNNINSTLVLCELMKEFSVFKMVFSSSATVYGTSQNVPLKETEPLGCTNPYGWTKMINEQILTDFARCDARFSMTLLRYFNPVGAHSSGEIGENPTGIPNNLMPFVCQVAVGKRKKLNVFGSDYPTHDGTGVRDYIHVVDLAKGHLAAYNRMTPGVHIYNLGTGHGYSVLDLVKAFERVNNCKIPCELVARRPGDIAVCYADPSFANQQLGWKAEFGLDEMCRDAYNWQQKYPNGYRDE